MIFLLCANQIFAQKTIRMAGKFSSSNILNDSTYIHLDSNDQKEIINRLNDLKKSNIVQYIKTTIKATTVKEKNANQLFAQAEKIKQKDSLLKDMDEREIIASYTTISILSTGMLFKPVITLEDENLANGTKNVFMSLEQFLTLQKPIEENKTILLEVIFWGKSLHTKFAIYQLQKIISIK